MANCNNCGAALSEGTVFCTHCGARTDDPATARQQAGGEFNTQPYYAPRDEEPGPGSAYAPVSTGAFVGYKLLMLIPIANIVMLIIWAVSGEKINRRNWARSELILMAIGVLAGILMVVLGVSVFAMVADTVQYYW